MKPLLDDKYASLQFEACDFLKDVYPKEVEETLNNLLVNKYEDVRNAAKKRLIELNK
jgi:hypothetical protein